MRAPQVGAAQRRLDGGRAGEPGELPAPSPLRGLGSRAPRRREVGARPGARLLRRRPGRPERPGLLLPAPAAAGRRDRQRRPHRDHLPPARHRRHYRHCGHGSPLAERRGARLASARMRLAPARSCSSSPRLLARARRRAAAKPQRLTAFRSCAGLVAYANRHVPRVAPPLPSEHPALRAGRRRGAPAAAAARRRPTCRSRASTSRTRSRRTGRRSSPCPAARSTPSRPAAGSRACSIRSSCRRPRAARRCSSAAAACSCSGARPTARRSSRSTRATPPT